MKITITIILTLILWSVLGQEKYHVKGKMQMVSYHQGGVELPPEMMLPFPMNGQELYLVKYLGPDKVPTILEKVKCDETGTFQINLPSGQYGFIQNKEELSKGIYLPGMKSDTNKDKLIEDEIFSGIGYEKYWSFDSNGPFSVGENESNSVVITYYDISICYMCP